MVERKNAANVDVFLVSSTIDRDCTVVANVDNLKRSDRWLRQFGTNVRVSDEDPIIDMVLMKDSLLIFMSCRCSRSLL